MVSDIYFQLTKKLHWHNGMELLAVCLCCILYFANKRKRPINILGFIIISKVVMSITLRCIVKWTHNMNILFWKLITVWPRTMNTWDMSGMLVLSNYACEIPSTNQSVYCYLHNLPSFLLLSCTKVQNVCVKLSNNWANEIQIDNLKQNYGETFFFLTKEIYFLPCNIILSKIWPFRFFWFWLSPTNN